MPEAKQKEFQNKSIRIVVISICLSYLEKIQEVSLEQARKSKNPNLIIISLYDLKLFNDLLNLIIIQGIYPSLPTGIGIPVNKRVKSLIFTAKVSKPSYDEAKSLLCMIVDTMINLINKSGDVSDLIKKGMGITDLVTALAELSSDPKLSIKERKINVEKFSAITSEVNTYELFTIYSSLLQPNTPAYFASFISRNISHLPIIRPNGIRTLIEFVTGMREEEQVSIEKLEQVTKLITSVPKGVPPKDYFTNVCRQIFEILADFSNEILSSAACHVVLTMYETKPRIIQDLLFSIIQSSIDPSDKTVDLCESDVIVSETQYGKSINSIATLLKRSSQSMVKDLLSKHLISLWHNLCFLATSKKSGKFVTDLLVSYLSISGDVNDMFSIMDNMLTIPRGKWTFKSGDNGAVEIRKQDPWDLAGKDNKTETIFEIVDTRVGLFKDILKELDADMINLVFIKILKQWLYRSNETLKDKHLLFNEDEEEDPFKVLVELKLLDMIANDLKSTLSRSKNKIIEIVSIILRNYQSHLESLRPKRNSNAPTTIGNIFQPSKIKDEVDVNSDDEDEPEVSSEIKNEDDSDDEDEDSEKIETVSTALSIISATIYGYNESYKTEEGELDIDLIQSIIPTVKFIMENDEQVQTKAQSVFLSLNEIVSKGEENKTVNNTIDPFAESRKLLQKALTNLENPLVPIRAYGLHLLTSLIKAKDPVLSVKLAISICLKQMKDNDSFIYLNSIKCLEKLVDIHRNNVLPILLRDYNNSRLSIDERLRIGEVVIRAVRRLGEAFVNEPASQIASSMLNIITRNENINKTPMDDKLRMSAMSILGCACETNPIGIRQYIRSSIDCALGILTFEKDEKKDLYEGKPDHETKAIMRRSAVVLLGSLIKGLDNLNDIPKDLSDKVVVALQYTVETDSDSLVRIQASTVLEIINEKIYEKFII